MSRQRVWTRLSRGYRSADSSAQEGISYEVIVVTHELASAFLIADRMVLIDKATSWSLERPRKCARVSSRACVNFWIGARTEVSQELDYLQMLTEGTRQAGRMQAGGEEHDANETRASDGGLFVLVGQPCW